MNSLKEDLQEIKLRIAKAAERCGRNAHEIKLIAVSKTHPSESIKALHSLGQTAFGESYAQEFKKKAEELLKLNIEWHFIGHLQRNKVKFVVPFAKFIHSVDSVKLAEEIDRRAPAPIKVLIEVNLSGETSKSGISKDQAEELAGALANMDNIELCGLMTMPPLDDDPEKARAYFRELRALMDDINRSGAYKKKLTELSMGMTGDLEVAIEEGATMVRVGTAIFGERE